MRLMPNGLLAKVHSCETLAASGELVALDLKPDHLSETLGHEQVEFRLEESTGKGIAKLHLELVGGGAASHLRESAKDAPSVVANRGHRSMWMVGQNCRVVGSADAQTSR